MQSIEDIMTILSDEIESLGGAVHLITARDATLQLTPPKHVHSNTRYQPPKVNET